LYFRTAVSPQIGAHDLPFIYSAQLQEAFATPQAWITRYGNSFGSDNVSTLWLWPYDFLGGALSKIGFSYSSFIKVFGILPSVLLGYFGIYTILKKANLHKNARVLGGLLYVTSTYFLLLIDGGQVQVALAYGMLPIVLQAFLVSLEKKTLIPKMYFGITLTLLGFCDFRFVYVALIVLALWTLVHVKQLKSAATTTIVGSLVLLIANIYWMYPVLVYRSVSLPYSYSQPAELGFLSFATFWHGFQFLAPHWYENIFGTIALINPLFFVVPFISFAAPVFVRRNKSVAFYLLVLAVGLLLSKGLNPPLESVNLFIFQNIPGMSLFRDPTKFYFLLGLGFAGLSAYTLNYLIEQKRVYLTRGVYTLFSLYLIGVVSPIISGKMTGILNYPDQVSEYNTFKEVITKKGPGRTLWIPDRGQLGFSSPLNPSLDMTILNQIRPFVSQSVGSYEINNFLREGSFVGELLSMSGISRIVYPGVDKRRVKLSDEDLPYHDIFFDQIARRPWAEQGEVENTLLVENAQAEIYPLSSMNFVLGPDSFYDEMASSSARLAGTVLIEQFPGLMEEVWSQNFPVLAFRKTETDIVASLIPSHFMHSIADSLKNDPDQSGWWKRGTNQFREARVFLQEKYAIDMRDFDYGHGWAFSEGNLTHEVKEPTIDGHLYIRVLTTTLGGMVSAVNNGNAIGTVSTIPENKSVRTVSFSGGGAPSVTEYEEGVFHWYYLGKTTKGTLSLQTKGELNAVTSIAVIPDTVQNEITQKRSHLSVRFWDEMSDVDKRALFQTGTPTTLSILASTPTSKEIEVSGTSGGAFIGFSNTYSPHWKIQNDENSQSYPLFTFLNAFYIPADGRYTLQYEPQTSVAIGSIASGIGIILITLVVLCKRK